MHIGARTLKTGLGIFIAIFLAERIPGMDPTLPALTIVFTMLPSVRLSIQSLLVRIAATIIGGIVAVIIGSFFGNAAIVIAFSAIILISILNHLKMSEVIGLAAMTLIIIMLAEPGHLFESAVIRTTESLLGVIAAFLVNTFVAPPRFSKKLFKLIDQFTNEVLVRTRALLRQNTNFAIMNQDISWLESQRSDIYRQFSFMKDETFIRKKRQWTHLRKVVAYRSLIQASAAAFKLLKTLHENENEYFQIDYELRVQIRERLETLMSGHEQLILKFSGRVNPNEVNFIEKDADKQNDMIDQVYNEVLDLDKLDHSYRETTYTILTILSAILEYERQLIRLNRIVKSYKKNLWNRSDEVNDYEQV